MDKINGKIFRGMLESGCNNLNNLRKEVDALNVFPVPDGDTGTNMNLTFKNGVAEVRKAGSENLPIVAKTLSRGLLMGARGNSGVILSQIFRGFYQSVGEQEEMDVKAFSEAMLNGAKLAYKAVMRPVEGTILTVVRESTDYANVFVEKGDIQTFEEYIDVLCKEAKESLDRTPELLPILKEARVVDSGGSGLVAVFDGFKAYLQGNPITETDGVVGSQKEELTKSGYCTELILKLSEQGTHLYKEDKFRSSLSKLGENITLITKDNIVKVRCNTMTPGEVLNLGQRFGDFIKLKVENMQEEQTPSIIEEEVEEVQEEKEYGIISVAAGEGLKQLFTEYRSDIVVSGGQTMNPSTEDFVEAINKVNAKHIFIFPNNSNIVMAAKQAASVIDGKDVQVIETVSIPQGLSACIAFNPDDSVEDNKANMLEAISNVKTGQVTFAIKDTTVDGREIKEGDYMGIFNKDIILTNRNKVDATCELITQMMDEDSEIITLICGEDATEEEIKKVQAYIEDNFDADVDIQEGKQPVYSFIIGIE